MDKHDTPAQQTLLLLSFRNVTTPYYYHHHLHDHITVKRQSSTFWREHNPMSVVTNRSDENNTKRSCCERRRALYKHHYRRKTELITSPKTCCFVELAKNAVQLRFPLIKVIAHTFELNYDRNWMHTNEANRRMQLTLIGLIITEKDTSLSSSVVHPSATSLRKYRTLW